MEINLAAHLRSDGIPGTNTVCLQALLDGLEPSAPQGGYSTGGYLLRFPAPEEPEGWYAFLGPLYLPQGVNLRMAGAASHAVLLRQEMVGCPLFIQTSPTGQETLAFERLTFHGGGIRLSGRSEAGVFIRDCNFQRIPGWAVASLPAVPGAGVERLQMIRCNVSECGLDGLGGVYMGASDRRWAIDNTVFTRTEGTAIAAFGTDLTLTGLNFETNRLALAEERSPFLHIGGPGQVKVLNCRFGKEDGHNCVPSFIVQIGPDEPSVDTPAIRDIEFHGAYFRGLEDPCASPEAGIRLTAPVFGLRISGTSSWDYDSFILEESLADVVGMVPAFSPQNALMAPISGATPVTNWFARRQAGVLRPGLGSTFSVVGQRAEEATQRVAPATRRGGNLLASSDPLKGVEWTTPGFELLSLPRGYDQ